jgi:hypothetical protein
MRKKTRGQTSRENVSLNISSEGNPLPILEMKNETRGRVS